MMERTDMDVNYLARAFSEEVIIVFAMTQVAIDIFVKPFVFLIPHI